MDNESTAEFADLRHRGPAVPTFGDPGLWNVLGGESGITELVDDLYRRLEQDSAARQSFSHFNSQAAARFFVLWFGGSRDAADTLEGGLLRRHQARYLGPRQAAGWLRCFRAALQDRGLPVDRILPPIRVIARAMIHSENTDPALLRKSCDGVQDPRQVGFEALLTAAARGRLEPILEALAADPDLGRRRGSDNRTLVWMAAFRNRLSVLEALLDAGAECNAPACEPLTMTLACDTVRFGTAVSVTPLAIARRWFPRLVPRLVSAGAISDVFTAAWLGDVKELRDRLDACPALIHAVDPADDAQQVSLLCHAVCSGSRDAVELLLQRGVEVRRDSGKLLTVAAALNRADLVQLLIDGGADVSRPQTLGRLDDPVRPVADLLIAHGKQVPDWMLPRACRPDVSSNERHRVQVLLDYGARLNDRGRYKVTALHYAVRGGKLPLVDFLLERGADPNVTCDRGETPLLHLARTRSQADPIPILERLVARGADVNARDESGTTLLMHLARRGDERTAFWLLDHGADPALRNRRGQSALDVCRRSASLRVRLRCA